jgi:hypothetical protein
MKARRANESAIIGTPTSITILGPRVSTSFPRNGLAKASGRPTIKAALISVRDQLRAESACQARMKSEKE